MTNAYYLIYKIFSFLDKKKKNHFIFVIFLSFFASFLEVATIGILIPFLNIILGGHILIADNKFFFDIKTIFNINTQNEFIIFFATVFIFFSIFSGFFRIFLLSYMIKLANKSSASIGVEVYKKTLFQPYQVHTYEGSSFVISGIIKKIQDVTVVLFSVVDFFSSILIFLSIFFFIVYADPIIILTSITFFSLVYIIFSITVKNKLTSNSEKIAREETAIVKALQEGMGSIRDVLLNQAQYFYINIYQSSILNLNEANGKNEFFHQSPRLFMEMIVIVFISILILILGFYNKSINDSLVSIGVLVLGSQRMLPLLNKVYVAWTTWQGKKSSLKDVVYLLDKKIVDLKENKEISFSINRIEFKNVDFKYDKSKNYIFKNLSIRFEAKKKIGIFGKSGSGKSTFLDLLTGLLTPSSGEILIGEKNLSNETDFFWKKKLSYISQDTYLFDTSILNNIALSDQFSKVDRKHAEDCAKKAKIHDFIISNGGYDKHVGERGVRLSGGQKQRIGIARALYKKSDIIIFDEATNALDNQTEEEVFKSIYELNKNLTVIIVSHRISSLKNCDEIYEVKEKKLIKI
jgi:ATP-binding cassette, subfamily B, bacterial PglK